MTAPAINRHRLILLYASVLLVLSAAFHDAEAKDDTILHAFSKSEGYFPQAPLVLDGSGNLYGTTDGGGSKCRHAGCGIVFKPAPDGSETILHSFLGKKHTDGATPLGPLLIDKVGSLYGTTPIGGSNCVKGLRSGGCGIVFKIAADGTETILRVFKRFEDGIFPSAGVIADKLGNLYGTTQEGGLPGCSGYGCGVIFRISPDGEYQVIHSFADATEGGRPSSPLISDSTGNLYGETLFSSRSDCFGHGCGTVYKLAPDGTFTTLYIFVGGSDGLFPGGGLLLDKSGNFFGVTSGGGGGCSGSGCGTVFKLAPGGTETILYAFKGGADGEGPEGLISNKAGDLFGTTERGGDSKCDSFGCGTVFEISTNGDEQLLYSFSGGNDGAVPIGGLIFDKAGNLYGTTSEGGGTVGCEPDGCGTVFELKH